MLRHIFCYIDFNLSILGNVNKLATLRLPNLFINELINYCEFDSLVGWLIDSLIYINDFINSFIN